MDKSYERRATIHRKQLGTWELVPRLADNNVIGTKWVYRNKNE